MLLSNTTETVSFASMKMTPSVAEKNQNSIHVVQFSNSSSTTIVPSKYRSLSGICTFLYGGSTFNSPCSLNSTGHILFTKASPLPGASIQHYNIQITLLGVANSLVSLAGKFVQYIKGTFGSFLPLAISRDQIQEVFISTNMNNFDIAGGAVSLVCRTNATGTLEYAVTIINSTAVKCTIPYANSTIISLEVFARFSELDATTYAITNPSVFTYIDKGSLQFTSANQTKFFYTGSASSSVYVMLNISYASAPMKSKVVCKLSQSSIFAALQSTSFAATSSLTSQQFLCNVSSTYSGIHNLSMWYLDEQGYTFELSAMPLQLVFLQPTSITSFSPVVGFANISTSVIVKTGLQNADYGIPTFYCKLSAPNNFGGNSTILALIVSFDTIQCTVFSSCAFAVQ